MTPRIAISVGDVNGIGPEVVVKALRDLSGENNFVPVLVGPRAILESQAVSALSLKAGVSFDKVRVDSRGFTIQPGSIDGEAGALAMECVQRAVELCLNGEADAIVTAPISKEAIQLGGYNYPGHTEFIAELANSPSPLMMMVSDRLRVALVTGHMALSEIPGRISTEMISKKLDALASSLRRDFGISRPELSVLGINPHAGDGGVLGSEEESIIRPAITSWTGDAIVNGPFPADAFFARAAYKRFDAVLAMYHDQGLIPFKTIAAGKGVNFTAGLPFVRTSPDHGTAFDIAGENLADGASMQAAIQLAVRICRNRVNHT